MICTTHLLVVACVLFSSAQAKSADCQETGTFYQKLEWAEKMLKSAKEEFPAKSLPMDCEELFANGVRNSGVYEVWPKNRITPHSIFVYCDMETDEGGWTVIQRRGNFSRKSDFFYQDWKAYKEGFGNLKEDFWLGNDKIYALTNQKLYSLRLDLTAFDGAEAYAAYDTFWIEEENSYYKLHVDGYRGNAGDALSYHNGYNFTTKDRDNDNSNSNCAENRKGPWWFNNCANAQLNGVYHQVKPPGEKQGILWYEWRGHNESLAATEMKIRRFPLWGN